MAMCGECLKELSSDEAHYERALDTDVVGNLNALLEVCVCVCVSTQYHYIILHSFHKNII